MKKINTTKNENDNKYYVNIYDNGNGINNLKNMLCASEGKVNLLGCKNHGFLDSLVYLSKLNGYHEIYTKCNDKYSKLEINLDDLNKEYQKQQNNERMDWL